MSLKTGWNESPLGRRTALRGIRIWPPFRPQVEKLMGNIAKNIARNKLENMQKTHEFGRRPVESEFNQFEESENGHEMAQNGQKPWFLGIKIFNLAGNNLKPLRFRFWPNPRAGFFAEIPNPGPNLSETFYFSGFWTIFGKKLPHRSPLGIS